MLQMKKYITNRYLGIKKNSSTTILLIATVLFSGCASVQYKNRGYNNFFKIYSDNCNEFKITVITDNVGFTVDKGSKLEITKFNKSNLNKNLVREVVTGPQNLSYDNSNNFVMQNFKKEGVKINLTHPQYDTIQLEIKRKIRPGTLAKDIGFSLFTLGIPLFVDASKSDFYKNKKDSKVFKVHFEYSQSFMRDEYMKIANSVEPHYFNKWIAKYPKSNLQKTAINTKDSLELIIAISKEQESAIDEFIISHKESNFLDEAALIKKEMSDARELFKNACINNTVESYEEFLLKYPNSLHNKEAHLKLVDAADKRALESRSSEKIVEYIIRYLKPNAHYITELSLEEKNWAIGKSESDIKFVLSQKLADKKSRLTKALDELIIQESGSLNSNMDYSAYSKMWKKYISLIDNTDIKPFINSFTNSEIERKGGIICSLLFNGLKEANTKEKQKEWIEKTLSDFPKFDSLPVILTSAGSFEDNLINRVLVLQGTGTGTIKLFDVNFFENTDFGNQYNFKKNYTYKNQTYNGLKNINIEEINFSKGKLSGIGKAYIDTLKAMSMTFGENSRINDISYYQNGKLVNTTYYPFDYNDYINPYMPEIKLNLNDYSYEFENGINLTLKMLEEKNKEGIELMKQGKYTEALSLLKKARENNFPKDLSQNLILDKSMTEVNKNKLTAAEKKQKERNFTNKSSYNQSTEQENNSSSYDNYQIPKEKCRRCDGTGKCRVCSKLREITFCKGKTYVNQTVMRPGLLPCTVCNTLGAIYEHKMWEGECVLIRDCYYGGCENGWYECSETWCDNGTCDSCDGSGYQN
jgi:hypothetical protein